MIEAIIVFGLLIAGGMAVLIAKLPRPVVQWLLGRPFALDLSVTLLVLWIHWGTMTGLMAAAVAGFTCSLVSSAARKLIGYRVKGRTVPGLFT